MHRSPARKNEQNVRDRRKWVCTNWGVGRCNTRFWEIWREQFILKVVSNPPIFVAGKSAHEVMPPDATDVCPEKWAAGYRNNPTRQWQRFHFNSYVPCWVIYRSHWRGFVFPAPPHVLKRTMMIIQFPEQSMIYCSSRQRRPEKKIVNPGKSVSISCPLNWQYGASVLRTSWMAWRMRADVSIAYLHKDARAFRQLTHLSITTLPCSWTS